MIYVLFLNDGPIQAFHSESDALERASQLNRLNAKKPMAYFRVEEVPVDSEWRNPMEHTQESPYLS